MGVVDGRHPLAHRLVGRVLERAGAARHLADFGAEEAHTKDVEFLAADVLAPHENLARQPEQRGGGGGGDAMLAGAGLGDDAALAEPFGQQALAERVVDLVRAGVAEVLALEEDARAPAKRLRQAARLVERGGAADVVAEQRVEFGVEGGVLANEPVFGLQLIERRDQRLGHVAPAEPAEVAFGIGERGEGREGGGSGAGGHVGWDDSKQMARLSSTFKGVSIRFAAPSQGPLRPLRHCPAR